MNNIETNAFDTRIHSRAWGEYSFPSIYNEWSGSGPDVADRIADQPVSSIRYRSYHVHAAAV